MRLPDYQGGSIVNLMASLQVGLGGLDHPYPQLNLLPADEISRHRQVLLWIIDGLGFNFLRSHPDAVNLNRELRGAMTSVFPPTTASAVTTFLTGDAPRQHGLTGWFTYFRELGSVFAVLPGVARFGGPSYSACNLDAAKLLGHTPFSDRIGVDAYLISPSSISGSDFNRAHLGRAEGLSFYSMEEMLSVTVNVLKTPGSRYIHLYWPELDTIGHRVGIQSEAAHQHLLLLDQAFSSLLERIQGTDTLVILCADHGQVDASPDEVLDLDNHTDLSEMLVLPLCGEPRAAYCYLRPGCERAFDDYVLDKLGNLAKAYPSQQLIDENWFGLGETHPNLSQRIGNRLLLMQSRAIIRDWLAQERRFEMVGVHGGLSDDELYVPLIMATA
ncbi:MAG: alkaline phosphatase family protein [Candidatus Thiodiazotropha sp. (ex Monitilora ramsayi)]|nr:alkaline phosphatase family protein [Candidatus Thiodiazotropha sp. (ex Monitilora ramsayi)]